MLLLQALKPIIAQHAIITLTDLLLRLISAFTIAI